MVMVFITHQAPGYVGTEGKPTQGRYPRAGVGCPPWSLSYLQQPEFWSAFLRGEGSVLKQRPHSIDPAVPFLGQKTSRVGRTQILSKTNRMAGESYLREEADHMQQVRIALRRPQCRLPVYFTNGMDTLHPHLAQPKSEALNFELESLLAADRGQVDAAGAMLAFVGERACSWAHWTACRNRPASRTRATKRARLLSSARRGDA